MPRRRKNRSDRVNIRPLIPGEEVWAYLRVSTGEQADRAIPIIGQRREIERWCADRFLSLTRVYADEGLSGGTDDRDQFREMVAEARRLQPAAILVWDWQRFSRDSEVDPWYYKSQLRYNGVDVIAITGELPDTPETRRFRWLWEDLAHFAAAEKRKEQSINAKRGQRALAEMGYVPSGSEPPRGYMVKSEVRQFGTRERTLRRWVPDPQIWPVARQAWEMRLAGSSYNDIAAATGLYKGANCFTTFFRNPIYKGELHFCGVIIPVEAVVTSEEWEKVQRKRMPPNGGAERRRAGGSFLLSGILRCGRCGAPMNGSAVVRRGVKPWPYYICTARKNRRECDMPQLGAAALERAVIEWLASEALADDAMEALAKVQAERMDMERPQLQARVAALQAKLNTLNGRIDRLLDAIEDGEVSSVSKRLRERETERVCLARELSDAEASLKTQRVELPNLEELRALLWRRFEEGPSQELRSLLGELVESITAHEDGRLEVIWRPPFA